MTARRRAARPTNNAPSADAPDVKESSRLPSEVQRAIVTRLAQFERPAEVRAAILAEFDRDVSLPHISYYDAEHYRPELAAEWRDLFRETRARFVTETADIAVAHRAVRLRKLGAMIDAAQKRGSFVVAGKLLEQAAKEVGDAFTNIHVLRAGDPAEELAKFVGLPVAEVRAIAAQLPAINAAP